jgi:hypothetical protein
MLIISILLFAAAALLGAYLLSFVLRNKATPKHIALFHGPIAATGLMLLIIYAVLNKPAPIVSIIIFILAALGGFVLIYRDLTGRSIPKWLAIGHGLTALVGFVLLLIFALNIISPQDIS